MAETGMAPQDDDTGTRATLVRVALRHFGQRGYEAASIRDICGEAGANVSAVKYHFGSKEALHAACVDAVIAVMQARGPAARLAAFDRDPARLSPAQATEIVSELSQATLRQAYDPAMADMTRFMQREILMEGRGVEAFHARALGPNLDMMAALVARAEARDPAEPGARLRALAVIGQGVFMALAANLLRAAMDWDDPAEHLPEMLDALRVGRVGERS